jgi:hypothetical protein
VRKVLVTFGGKAYDPSIAMTLQNKDIAKVDEIRVYDDAWLLESPFYSENKWIFDREPKNHLGHCSWKPYIIFDAMMKLSTGDVVLYVDADTHPIADLTPLFQLAEREKTVLFEATGVDNLRFTKAECFARILGRAPFSSQHACGRFQLFTVGDVLSMTLLFQWQKFNLDPLCQFDEGSTTMPDQPEFFRNSAEQSVLSMLALKYNIPLHREACQYGWPAHPGIGRPEDTYPQLFHQEWATGDRNDVSGSIYRNV